MLPIGILVSEVQVPILAFTGYVTLGKELASLVSFFFLVTYL